MTFAFDSARLSPAALAALARTAGDIQEYADPGRPVVVVGHTDSIRSADYNQRLSLQRADAVADALAGHLGGPDRLEQNRPRRRVEPSQPEGGERSVGRLSDNVQILAVYPAYP